MKREENIFEMYGNKLLSILSLLFLLCFVGEIPIATIQVRERDIFTKGTQVFELHATKPICKHIFMDHSLSNSPVVYVLQGFDSLRFHSCQ